MFIRFPAVQNRSASSTRNANADASSSHGQPWWPGGTEDRAVGKAGARMMKEFGEFGINSKHIYTASNYIQVVEIANDVTENGKICLLSPAAASYDMFRNFEERGNTFKKNVRDLSPSHLE